MLDPQLGQEDSAMLGESRPMLGRNLGTVVALAVALVGCGGDDLLSPLALPAVELGHVGARVRRLEVGHALRAAQVDQHVLVTLRLAPQRLQEARSAARAGGQRHAPRK